MEFTSFAVPERWVEDDTGEIIISTATTGKQLIADLKLFALAPRMAEVLVELGRPDEAEALLGSLLTTTPPGLAVRVAESVLDDIRGARLN